MPTEIRALGDYDTVSVDDGLIQHGGKPVAGTISTRINGLLQAHSETRSRRQSQLVRLHLHWLPCFGGDFTWSSLSASVAYCGIRGGFRSCFRRVSANF